MTEHTPTPWYSEENKIYGSPTCMNGDTEIVNCFEIACNLIGEAKANATLIVKAVNTHDELLAALKDLYEACSTDVPKDLTESISLRVEKAIRKAEGE